MTREALRSFAATRAGATALLGVKLALTAGVLYLIFRLFPLEDIAARIAGAAPGWLTVAFLLILGQAVLAIWRWRIVLDALAAEAPRWRHLALLHGLGVFFSQVLPSTISGDAVRGGLLSRRLALGTAFASVALDRVAGLIGLFVVVVPSSLLAFAIVSPRQPILLWPPTLAVAGLVTLGLLHAYAHHIVGFGAFARRLATLLGGLRVLSPGKASGRRVMALSLAIHVVTIPVFLALMFAFGGAADLLWVLAGVLPSAMLISAVPITFGGWGLREGALISGFALLGLPAELPLSASVLFGLSQVAIGLVACLIWLVASRIGTPAPPS